MRVLAGCFVNTMPLIVLLLVFLCSAPAPLLADENKENPKEIYLGLRGVVFLLNGNNPVMLEDDRYHPNYSGVTISGGGGVFVEGDLFDFFALGGEFNVYRLDFSYSEFDNINLDTGLTLRFYIPYEDVEPYLRLSGGFSVLIPGRTDYSYCDSLYYGGGQSRSTLVRLAVDTGYGGYNSFGLGMLFRVKPVSFFGELGYHGVFYKQTWSYNGHPYTPEDSDKESVSSMMFAFGITGIL